MVMMYYWTYNDISSDKYVFYLSCRCERKKQLQNLSFPIINIVKTKLHNKMKDNYFYRLFDFVH
jgi:hypothetical protein